MLQQIVVDSIRSRCTGFGIHDWLPQISQSKRLVVNFSVVWGGVNFVLLLLLFYGLECSTVVGRGGVVCKCCCIFISNIFRVGDGSTILPIWVLLGRSDIFTRYFPHSIPHMLHGCISWQLWDICCPWLTFLLVEESTGLRLRFSESRQTFPSNSRLCRTLLARAHLAFRASRHSSSNQGFDWIGLDLFSDAKCPSGHIIHPTHVNVSQTCLHSLNKLLKPYYIVQVWGLAEVDNFSRSGVIQMMNCIEYLTIHVR